MEHLASGFGGSFVLQLSVWYKHFFILEFNTFVKYEGRQSIGSFIAITSYFGTYSGTCVPLPHPRVYTRSSQP